MPVSRLTPPASISSPEPITAASAAGTFLLLAYAAIISRFLKWLIPL
jgi:hypothetical protein